MTSFSPESDASLRHARLLYKSFERCTGRSLLSQEFTPEKIAEALLKASFALVSHGTEEDPVFNFGNHTALELFELPWEEFIRLPSRESAEPVNRAERKRLLDQVTRHGYIDDYSGVRVSSTGRRFMIHQATVWNVVDEAGRYHGQAAAFDRWTFL